MVDRHDQIGLEESDGSEELSQRLDALGRDVVDQEGLRTEPGREYLEAVARRAMFARGRIMWVWGAVAAVFMLAIGTAMLLNSGSGRINPKLVHANQDPAVVPVETAPTVADLARMNRDINTTDGLRLGDTRASTAPASASPGSVRAGDIWRADRVEAVAGGR